MFIPFVENVELAFGQGALYLTQIVGFNIKTFALDKCFAFFIPVENGMAVLSFYMDMYREMLFAVKEKAEAE